MNLYCLTAPAFKIFLYSGELLIVEKLEPQAITVMIDLTNMNL